MSSPTYLIFGMDTYAVLAKKLALKYLNLKNYHIWHGLKMSLFKITTFEKDVQCPHLNIQFLAWTTMLSLPKNWLWNIWQGLNCALTKYGIFGKDFSYSYHKVLAKSKNSYSDGKHGYGYVWSWIWLRYRRWSKSWQWRFLSYAKRCWWTTVVGIWNTHYIINCVRVVELEDQI